MLLNNFNFVKIKLTTFRAGNKAMRGLKYHEAHGDQMPSCQAVLCHVPCRGRAICYSHKNRRYCPGRHPGGLLQLPAGAVQASDQEEQQNFQKN